MKKKHIVLLIALVILFSCVILLLIKFSDKVELKETLKEAYIASNENEVILYDSEYKEVVKLTRGIKVNVYSKELTNEDKKYKKIEYKNKEYLVDIDNVVLKEKDVVKEDTLYVRTSSTIYKDLETAEILSFVKKGEKVEIIGFDKLNEDGTVNKYKIKYNNNEGYIYSKYLVTTEEESKKVYSENGIQEYMSKMGSALGGGNALNLDYYPYEKPKFEDNVMPDEVRSLYI